MPCSISVRAAIPSRLACKPGEVYRRDVARVVHNDNLAVTPAEDAMRSLAGSLVEALAPQPLHRFTGRHPPISAVA